MGTQVIEVNRQTGALLWRGYDNPDTQMSEAWAECAMKNYSNTDVTKGFLVVNTEALDVAMQSEDTFRDYLLRHIRYARQGNTYSFNSVFDWVDLS